MKHSLHVLLCLLGFFTVGTVVYSQTPISAGITVGVVEVYPGPGENAYKSDLYRVEVSDGTRWLETYTYKIARKSNTSFKGAGGADPSVNFAIFGTTAILTVRVSKLLGSITSAEISPKSKNIVSTISNGSAIFELRPYDKAWVVVDGDNGDPLFVFANPLKPAVPPGAVYFGPGVHDIGLAFGSKSGQAIYLDGGAWVIGTIDLRGRHDVRILGPGVLSGEKWSAEIFSHKPDNMIYRMIIGDKSSASTGNRLEDIAIVNSPSYNIYGGPEYIGNVKLLSPWWSSTDGFQVLPRGANRLALIERCFAFVGDDIFFPRENYLGNIEIRNCFVSSTNNSVFQISYWGNTLDHQNRAYVHDIDIKNYLPKHNSAVFRASICKATDTGVKNMTFENIRIEGALKCPLVQIENREYFWPEQTTHPETKLGNTWNMVFRNISAEIPADKLKTIKSTLLGLDSENSHHDYLFENVRINGVVLDQTNYPDYFRVNNFTSGIHFSAQPFLKDK